MKALFEVKGNAIYAVNAVNPSVMGGMSGDELQTLADEMNARRQAAYDAERNGESFVEALARLLSSK